MYHGMYSKKALIGCAHESQFILKKGAISLLLHYCILYCDLEGLKAVELETIRLLTEITEDRRQREISVSFINFLLF